MCSPGRRSELVMVSLLFAVVSDHRLATAGRSETGQEPEEYGFEQQKPKTGRAPALTLPWVLSTKPMHMSG